MCASFVWSYKNILGNTNGKFFALSNSQTFLFWPWLWSFPHIRPHSSLCVCFTFPILPVCLFQIVCILVRSLRECSLVIVSSCSVFCLIKTILHILYFWNFYKLAHIWYALWAVVCLFLREQYGQIMDPSDSILVCDVLKVQGQCIHNQ